MGNRISAFLLVILMGLLWVGCGGGGSGSGENESVQSLLKETFSGAKTVKSGVVGLSFSLNGKGGGLNGPVTFKLGGPFASQGAGKLPKFQLGLNAQAQGQSFSAGATSTGDKAFVNFRGTDYLVDDNTFKAVKAAYEQAQTQANGKKQNPSLGTLGINPSAWLTNPKNEGSAKVGNDDAIKITGGVNINKLLDDVNQALGKARNLGVQGTQSLPSQLTAAQRKQVTDAVKNPKVEIYTGKDDKILRRMVVSLGSFGPGRRRDALGT